MNSPGSRGFNVFTLNSCLMSELRRVYVLTQCPATSGTAGASSSDFLRRHVEA